MSDAWLTLSLVSLAIIGYLLPVTKHEKVKIVEEPAVYRSGLGGYYQPPRTPESDKLVARVKPSPVSGPPHLRILAGKCFSLINNGYKYEFCPFGNVTQKEQTMRWNAFSGILGVWKEWLIVNNTFEAMLLANGDMCPGGKPRQTKVFVKCGDANKLISVGEPQICHYEMMFETPLGCPIDAFLVYPALSREGQKEWEGIEEALYREELTVQGYHKYRRWLFQKERLIPSDRNDKEVKEDAKQVMNAVDSLLSNHNGDTADGIPTFHSIEQCSEAYVKLLEEVSSLRKQLQLSNLTTEASKDPPASTNHTDIAKHHPTVNTTTHLREKGDRGRNLHRT